MLPIFCSFSGDAKLPRSSASFLGGPPAHQKGNYIVETPRLLAAKQRLRAVKVKEGNREPRSEIAGLAMLAAVVVPVVSAAVVVSQQLTTIEPKTSSLKDDLVSLRADVSTLGGKVDRLAEDVNILKE